MEPTVVSSYEEHKIEPMVKKGLLFCDECGKGFRSRENLKTHIRVHTGEKPFVCNVCGRAFSQSSSLKCHLRIHTGEKPFSCGECGKSFCQITQCRRHMGTHTGERPYHCQLCPKGFWRRAVLEKHEKIIHGGEKPFACEECGMAFSEKLALRRHRKTHRQKLFTCDECGKVYKQNYSLKLHMKRHTGEKPFDCKDCGKKTKDKATMKLHLKIHTLEPQYPCKGCGKKIKESNLPNCSISLVMGKKAILCKECGIQYRQTGHLVNHSGLYARDTPLSSEKERFVSNSFMCPVKVYMKVGGSLKTDGQKIESHQKTDEFSVNDPLGEFVCVDKDIKLEDETNPCVNMVNCSSSSSETNIKKEVDISEPPEIDVKEENEEDCLISSSDGCGPMPIGDITSDVRSDTYNTMEQHVGTQPQESLVPVFGMHTTVFLPPVFIVKNG